MPTFNRVSTIALVVIIGIAVWRRISKKRHLQEKIHKCCKKGSVLIQWYFLLTIAMVGFVVYSVIEYFIFYRWYSESQQTENLSLIWGKSSNDDFLKRENITTFEEFQDKLKIPDWILVANSVSQTCGIVTIAIVIYQMWAKFVLPTRRAALTNQTWSKHEWHMPKRVNWILWILVVPTVFCIESMRANTKVWGLVTGTSKEFGWLDFSEAEKLELLYAREDIEIASVIQFSAIYAFTRLISSMLEQTALIKDAGKMSMSHAVLGRTTADNSVTMGNDNEEAEEEGDEMTRLALEYKRLTRIGGFLGLWVYIAAGGLRALITIGLAIILQIKVKDGVDDPTVKFLEDAEVAFDGITSTAFVLLTVLSVVTMIVMSRTFIVTEKLGDANKKFTGARLMLLASEIVPKVIDAFEIGTPVYEQTKQVTQYVKFLWLTREQAEMLKVAILNLACLVTVILNLVFWSDVDIDEADTRGLLDFPEGEEAVQTMDDQEAPLLDD